MPVTIQNSVTLLSDLYPKQSWNLYWEEKGVGIRWFHYQWKLRYICYQRISILNFCLAWNYCSVFCRTITNTMWLSSQLHVVINFQLPELNKYSWDVLPQSFSDIKEENICISNPCLSSSSSSSSILLYLIDFPLPGCAQISCQFQPPNLLR